jgi:uncharacterized protein YqgV (UPF0045/DUF77 family)
VGKVNPSKEAVLMLSVDDVINNSLQVLEGRRVTYDVGPVSTYITGDDRLVWAGLQGFGEQARRLGGEVSMVKTVTDAQPILRFSNGDVV